MANPFILISLLMMLLFTANGFAINSTYYSHHVEGWFWYHDPHLNQLPYSETDKNKLSSLPDPIIEMNQLHEALNRSLDRAILYPTKENVKNYIVLQKRVSNRSMQFSELWKTVLLENPGLDYEITHPTSTQGNQLYLIHHQKQQDQLINHFAKENGLIFFYRGDCPYCHQFAPILKAFVNQYGISVIPVTLGAGVLAEFPDSQINQGEAELFHVAVWPSLFAVNPISKKITPVANGFLTFEALRQRLIETIMRTL